jgi:hypothetical protein
LSRIVKEKFMSNLRVRLVGAPVFKALAISALLGFSFNAAASDNPFVGKEWLIKFAEQSPRVHFPTANYQSTPLLIVEHFQHRWYKIRFTYGNNVFEGDPPEHLRGVEDEFWISESQIVSISPPLAEPSGRNPVPALPTRMRGN